MIKFIDDIEIIETDTELDALVLECKLIKKTTTYVQYPFKKR